MKGMIFLENKKKKKNNTGAGFYIALCCCVAAIGIVGFVNTRRRQASEELPAPTARSMQLPTITISPDLKPESKPVNDSIEAQAPKLEEESDTSDAAPASAAPVHTKAPAAATEEPDVIESGEDLSFYDGNVVESISIAQQPKFIMPADGEICCGFSGSTLYYDSVMGDFRTHNGIDIKAASDSNVVAAYDGKIESVYTDTLGKTVLLDHGNGFKTKYSNLDDIDNLSEGMELKQGDFIAHVGSYAFGENTTEPHLHFEIIKDGEFVNPEDYFE